MCNFPLFFYFRSNLAFSVTLNKFPDLDFAEYSPIYFLLADLAISIFNVVIDNSTTP